jgi:hypothetical protein
LLGAGVLIEISIVMILLSRILKVRANRWANIIAGIFLAVVQLVPGFYRKPTLAYAFFSIIMIATAAVIVWYAWRWSDKEVTVSLIQKSLDDLARKTAWNCYQIMP